MSNITADEYMSKLDKLVEDTSKVTEQEEKE